MTCIRVTMPSGHALLHTGGEDKSITVRGKTWYYELHPYHGPTVVNKDGSEKANVPQYVWDAVTKQERG